MLAFDREEAASFIAGRLDARLFGKLIAQGKAEGLVRQALDADLAYMRCAGVIDEAGAEGNAFYDDDDAFEYLLDRLSRERGTREDELDDLTDFIDQYMDLMQAYMEEKGLLSWS